MDFLEYRTAYSNSNAAYIAYSFHPAGNANDRYTLYTGSGLSADNLPKGTLDCRSFQLTEDMVSSVNKFNRQMFVVQQQQRGYMVVPVTAINKITRSGSFYLVSAPNYSFIFDTTNLNIGTNLATAGSQAAVSLNTFGVRNCRYQYAFRRSPYEQGKEQAEFDFIAGIGIVNERSGRNATEMMSNQTTLWGVNGQALEDFINRGCGGPAPTSSAALPPPGPATGVTQPEIRLGDPAAGTVTQPGATYAVSAISGQPVINCAKSSTPGYHVVQPKETVNSIARFYGVSAKQIVEWNKLKSADKITICQELRVVAPGMTAKSPVLPASPTQYNATNSAPVITLPATQTVPPGGYQPVQPAQPSEMPGLFNAGSTPAVYSTPTPTLAPTPAPVIPQAGQYYQVQPGEGLISIAAKFGYTEQRLRAMNGLPATGDPKLKAGQLLKVSDCDVAPTTPGTGAVAPKDPGVVSPTNTTPTAPIIYNTQPASPTGFVPLGQGTAPAITQPGTQPPAPNSGFVPLGGTTNPVVNTVQPTQPTGPAKQPIAYQEYFVKDSETIRDIARKKKLGISAEELALINGRDVNEVLPPGTKVQIPVY